MIRPLIDMMMRWWWDLWSIWWCDDEETFNWYDDERFPFQPRYFCIAETMTRSINQRIIMSSPFRSKNIYSGNPSRNAFYNSKNDINGGTIESTPATMTPSNCNKNTSSTRYTTPCDASEVLENHNRGTKSFHQWGIGEHVTQRTTPLYRFCFTSEGTFGMNEQIWWWRVKTKQMSWLTVLTFFFINENRFTTVHSKTITTDHISTENVESCGTHYNNTVICTI